MARLPSVASLFDSGVFVFGKEWRHLTSAIVLLSLPLYLLSIGLETNPALVLPYIILAIFIGPLISIITTTIVYFRYEKEKTIHSQSLYKFIHDTFFPTLWTSILVSLIVILSMTLLAIPLAVLGIIYFIAQPTLIIAGALTPFGLVSTIVLIASAIIISIGASVYMLFSLPIVILEKKSGLNAINKSISLVKGRWWNIFGRVLLLQLIALFISSIITIFGGAIFGNTNLGFLISSLLQQVAILPISIAMIVFYLDIKEKSSKKMVTTTASTRITKKRSKKVSKSKTTKKSAKKKSTKKTAKKRKK